MRVLVVLLTFPPLEFPPLIFLACRSLIAMWLVSGLCRADEQTALKSLIALGARATADQQRADMPIVQLSLSGPQITDDVMWSVIELDKIQSLTISKAAISDVGLKRLTALTDLRRLALFGCRITDHGLAELSSCVKLESLDLRGTSAFASGQTKPLFFPVLKRLQISAANKLDLSILAELHALEELTIVGGAFQAELPSGLSPLKQLNNLTVLELNYLPETALRGIDQATSLREVKFTGAGWLLANSGHVLTRNGVLELKSLTNLRSLDLTGREISVDGYETLGQLRELQHLKLKGSNISDAELVHLKQMNSLISLELDGTNVTENGVSDLRLTLKSATIVFQVPKESEAAKAAKKELGKKGGMFSASIRTDTYQETVSFVGLRRSRVLDDDLMHLLAFPELSTLDLSETVVTDSGLDSLLKLKQLSTLKLNGTNITDLGIQQLSQLTGLRTLELSGLPITEAGLKKLQELKKLRKLTIAGNNVSGKSIDELKAALPDLVVTVQ